MKDAKAEDLTRQPEQIKAFRDTWELGIHSYLSYLRDRLAVARDLLTESGSIFVQIGDENVHLVRCRDGRGVREREFRVADHVQEDGLDSCDLAELAITCSGTRKDRTVKYRQLYYEKQVVTTEARAHQLELPDGHAEDDRRGRAARRLRKCRSRFLYLD